VVRRIARSSFLGKQQAIGRKYNVPGGWSIDHDMAALHARGSPNDKQEHDLHVNAFILHPSH
jgi:hypothetical protein